MHSLIEKSLPLALALVLPAFASAARADEPVAVKSDALHKLYKISGSLYSGAEPDTEEAFAELNEMGVRTIVSVDGARTNTKLAEKYGIKYIHLPVGYEGISNERAIEIAKAAMLSDGPVYFHCHHGAHRGPAGAALAAVALGDLTNEEAVAWMKAAGTSPNYAGLYRCVRKFRKPTKEQLDQAPNEFPAQVEPESFIEAMVELSITWDQLKELAAAGFKTPADNPDLTAAHEALQLNEHYREMMRTGEYNMHDDDLQAAMTKAERHSAEFHKLLKQLEKEGGNAKSELRKKVEAQFGLVGTDCKSCHTMFRDKREVK